MQRDRLQFARVGLLSSQGVGMTAFGGQFGGMGTQDCRDKRFPRRGSVGWFTIGGAHRRATFSKTRAHGFHRKRKKLRDSY